MNTLRSFIAPSISFITANHVAIISILIVITLFYLGFTITSLSLKKLRVKIFSYYPFDRFFPQSGSWSVVYFIVTIVLLGIIIYLLARGNFYLAPA